MELENLPFFADFGAEKYLLNCGSRRNRLAGTEPIPVRFSNTGWGTLRRPFALVSIENVVIVTESCEVTVCTFRVDTAFGSCPSRAYLVASRDSADRS